MPTRKGPSFLPRPELRETVASGIHAIPSKEVSYTLYNPQETSRSQGRIFRLIHDSDYTSFSSQVADYAPRGKRVMLPLSKFAFLPEKIQIGLDQVTLTRNSW